MMTFGALIVRLPAPGWKPAGWTEATASNRMITTANVEVAAAIRKDGRLAEFVKNRYASWDTGIGAKIEAGKTSFKDLETYMIKKGEAAASVSGRQEYLENLINEFI